jgi:hypothetical protein
MITEIGPLLEPGATVVAAPYAPAGPIIAGTSATPHDVSIGGVYVWVMDQTGLGFVPGVRVRAAAPASITAWIEGVVTAFDNINLTVQSDLINGAGVYTAWNINVAGQPGKTGATGNTGAQGPPGTAAIPPDAFLPGNPTAPTPLQGDNDMTIATTAFVTTAVQFSKIDPIFTGDARCVTPPISDNDTSIATTAFVQAIAAASAASLASYAPINAPVFTGDARAVTPAPGDNDTSIATTAFVAAATAPLAPINAPVFTGDARAVTPAPGDNDTSIATTAFVHAAVAPLAPLASPAFSGTPTSITPGAGSNDTSLATTAFVFNATLSLAPLISPHFTGTAPYPTSPTPASTSFDSSIATTAFVKTATAQLAPLNSPVFTNSPSAPTQPPATYDSTLATTAFVKTNAAGYQPLSADLTSLSGLSGAGIIYYRSGSGTWSPVEIGANITFDGGVLSAAGGGTGSGGIPEAPSTGTYFARRNATWAATPIQADAPSDGVNYVRLNATWSSITTALAAFAPINAPTFTGDAKAVTPGLHDNDTSIATTAYVQTELSFYALLAGPAFSGVPSAPTPAAASNDGTLATTAFVKTATSSLAPLNAPVFTGDARAVTPAAGDNDTSIATTQFVQAAIAVTDAQILVGQLTGGPQARTVGGDVTMDDTAAFTVGANKITYAKMQPVSASSRVLGRISSGAGNPEELTGANLVTIIDGNLSTLMAPGNWNIFYSNGAAIYTSLALGAANTSLTSNGPAVAPSWMAWATAAQYAGNSANALLSSNAVWAAAALQTLTDAATVTPDFSTGFDFIWTIAAAGRTLANAANLKVGQKGIIYLVQDATGSRTITTWGTSYKFSAGAKPTLTAAANSVDIISYCVRSATAIECFFTPDLR